MKKLLMAVVMVMVVFEACGAVTPVNVGTVPNDQTGDKLRDAFIKVNANTTDLDTRVKAVTPTNNPTPGQVPVAQSGGKIAWGPLDGSQLTPGTVSSNALDSATKAMLGNGNGNGRREFIASDYWTPDGTDRSAGMSNLLNAVYAAGGGVIYFPPAANSYRADSQMWIPNNNNANQPTQPLIQLIGADAGQDWHNITNPIPVVIDLRYNGTNGGKIESRGKGVLEIDHLVIKDGTPGAASSKPIIHVSNTTLKAHDLTMIGCGNAAQDFIVLGGTNTVISAAVDAPFQGYGTLISGVHFTKGNRGVYALTWGNGIVVENCTFQGNTGSIGIESDGTASSSQGNYGFTVRGCVIEMDSYKYGVILQATRGAQIDSTSFYDAGAQVVSDVCVTNGTYGAVIAKCYDAFGSKPTVVGGNTEIRTTTIISGDGNRNETLGNGKAANEMAYGLVVRGTYTPANYYPGPFTVMDQFGTGQIGLGYDGTANAGVLQSSISGSAKPIVINPRGGNVGIGTTNPASLLSVAGDVAANNITLSGANSKIKIPIDPTYMGGNTNCYWLITPFSLPDICIDLYSNGVFTGIRFMHTPEGVLACQGFSDNAMSAPGTNVFTKPTWLTNVNNSIGGNGAALTGLLLSSIVSTTNAMPNNNTIDFSVPESTTNATGNIGFSTLANLNPTNYNKKVVHILANGADRTVTCSIQYCRQQGGPYTATNGTTLDVNVECQVNLFTNFSVKHNW